MNDTYLDIHIAVPPDEHLREIIPTAFSDHPFEGFVEDDRGMHCFIKKAEWHGSIETLLNDFMESYNISFIQHIATTEIQHKNWNEEWEKTIQPIHVSDQFIITPSWHTVNDPNKHIIIIDPKMTFGTGYHETTRLMIRMMEQYLLPHSSVLDVGTGTGILAIAAAKLGAKHIVGIDIDEWSLQNGIENAERNHVQNQVEIRIGSMAIVAEYNFDMILANIFRTTIIELMDSMVSKLSSSGRILLSGLLLSDRPYIEAALLERNFVVLSVMQENEWIAIAAHHQ